MIFFKIFSLLSICFISRKNELKMNINNTTNITPNVEYSQTIDFILYDFN